MKKRRLLKTIVLLLVIAAALICDSNTRPVLTEYEVASPKLPESFDGFRIVQLSDHRRLLELVASADADIIVITGDMVDEEADLAVADALLAELVKLAPVYYVSGNHEWGGAGEDEMAAVADILSEVLPGRELELDLNLGVRRIDAVEAILAAHGAEYLRNEYVLLERGEESIVLAGVEDPNGPFDMLKPQELVDIIVQEQGRKFTVLLGHRNYWAEKYPDLKVDIIFCGHAHGGIVRLPLVGGVLGTGFEFFPENVDGAVDCGGYTMIVSRGLGGSVPVPRFLNNPEIVLLTLKSE